MKYSETKIIFMPAPELCRSILQAGCVPAAVVNQILQAPISAVSVLLQSISGDDNVREDHNGILSYAPASLRKRRGFLSTIHIPENYAELNELFDLFEVLSSSHFRPVRASATLAAVHLVESLLQKETVNQAETPTDDTKLALTFCGKVTSSITYNRSRDTFTPIRQAVCDHMFKIAQLNSEILTSSIFNGKFGNYISTFSSFLVDDEFDIRVLAIEKLDSLVSPQSANIPSKMAQKISADIFQYLLPSALRISREISELSETGNPPYIARLAAELESLVRLAQKIINRFPTQIDKLEDKNIFDNF